MRVDETRDRPAFADLLSGLTDSDLVIEVAARDGEQRSVDSGAITRLREAVEASYKALAGSVPVQLETVAVVEEVSKRSLSVWLRVRRAGDGALGESSDGSLLKFLARGTLAIVAWMDGSPTLQLADLQQALRVLVWGTSVTTASQPALPLSSDLVDAISVWQKAKGALSPAHTVRIVTNNGSAQLDLSKRIAEPRTLLQARRLVNHSADMIFLVEMPDYQGSGEWRLKHGGTRTTAIAEPGTLLDKFYRRELDIRPGDALRCKVDFETSYGPDHEVLAERYRIVEILEVLPPKNADAEQAAAEERPAVPLPAHEPEPASFG